MARCDLHVHSVYSTDSGNYALRRARLGESFTPPERVYDTCRARGMQFVTISDHNTLEGALRIADQPGTFLSVEVTTCFSEDETPLHVLVWGLSEEDHRDLQPYRSSVVELVAFLRARGLHHALAHPLYRMGATLTASHVERMMLLFGIWEGRNGARPASSNELACRLAAAVGPAYLAKLADRHGIEPVHSGRIALCGGSDDHGALDIATSWTEAEGTGVDSFLDSVAAGAGTPMGEHGSTVKLAHAVGSLALNAYRREGRELPPLLEDTICPLFDGGGEVTSRHDEITQAACAIAHLLGERARNGGLGLDAIPTMGGRLASLMFAGALELPYVASVRHHGATRADVEQIEASFFGPPPRSSEPRAVVFTDTFSETNGVAGTMRLLALASAQRQVSLVVATADPEAPEAPGVMRLDADWSLPLPAYEQLALNFPLLTKVLARIEELNPDVVHVATPGPVGLCGLAAAKVLGLPLVGSYHTELGPYALHLTKDAVVADAFSVFVDWFYRQCDAVLAPTRAVAERLERRELGAEIGIWGRGVDTELFNPNRRSEALRTSLLSGAEVLALSVGRVSDEKRLEVLLDALALLAGSHPELRLVVAGDGPARERLQREAGGVVRFLGELRGGELATLYASADLFCFPSTTDTFGQVLLEAGASGLPVVAARAGGAPELVADGESGILVAPDDPSALAEAIARLVSSSAERGRLGARARELAAMRSWSRSLEELRGAYVGVLAARSARIQALAERENAPAGGMRLAARSGHAALTRRPAD